MRGFLNLNWWHFKKQNSTLGNVEVRRERESKCSKKEEKKSVERERERERWKKIYISKI